jgi:hypothetical protein
MTTVKHQEEADKASQLVFLSKFHAAVLFL